MGPRAWREDDAVSEVVGTILLVAISVMLFAGLSMVVWQQMQTSPAPANADVRLDVDGDWVTLTHVWGENLPVKEVRLLIEVNDVRGDYALDEAPLADHLDHVASGSAEQWDLGETLWLRCPTTDPPQCAFPNKDLGYVTGVDERANAVVFSNQPGVTPGLILNPLPDLAAAAEAVENPTGDGMYEDCEFRFSAIVANTGLEPTASTDKIVTTFYLDGTAFHTHERSTPLQVGSSYEVTTTRTVLGADTHLFRVVVDEADTIVEISEQNEDQRSFSLSTGTADPGFAFEDGNDNGFYAGCQGDMDVQALIEDDGVHSTAAGAGLVIPPSVSISLSVPASLTASGALTIGATLTATGTIDLDAGGDVVLDGATLKAEGYNIFIDSSAGAISADGLLVPVGTTADAARLEARAAEYITMQNARINTRDAILIDASGVTGTGSDSLLLQKAHLVAKPGSDSVLPSGDAIRLNGDGDVRADELFLRTSPDLIGINVDVDTNTLHLQDLVCETFTEGETNQAVLTPLGAPKSGSTTKCNVVSV